MVEKRTLDLTVAKESLSEVTFVQRTEREREWNMQFNERMFWVEGPSGRILT